jgi:hypothetical protein
MSSQSTDELAARFDALERENRTLKGLLIAVIGSLVAVGASSGPPKTIEAQEFVLKDGNGGPADVWFRHAHATCPSGCRSRQRSCNRCTSM